MSNTEKILKHLNENKETRLLECQNVLLKFLHVIQRGKIKSPENIAHSSFTIENRKLKFLFRCNQRN